MFGIYRIEVQSQTDISLHFARTEKKHLVFFFFFFLINSKVYI